ncbi:MULTISPECIES: 50S ribosomal protein L33 [unclassified Mycoplasma]|nr:MULTISPECIES: 50S ribosomal protein L33 [unclassified Mycoplasma]UUM20077.1 50S ribosomal protein L33 [Mycoplasma sp. 1578d]UUM25057.1 50S ribosomal protein L33 [Mycoplasma sp. 3686d]
MKNKVAIACEICRRKNYITTKSNGNDKRVILKKFCPPCKEHTFHKEEV